MFQGANDFNFATKLPYQLFFYFFVLIGAKSATPNQGANANVCPPGRFCPEGTDEPEFCPTRTFSNVAGKMKSA